MTVVDDDAVTAPVQVAAGEVLPTEPLTVALTAAQETIDEANGRTRLVIALSRVLGGDRAVHRHRWGGERSLEHQLPEGRQRCGGEADGQRRPRGGEVQRG